MTRERARAAVIGGGVVGCAVLHELAAQGVDGAVLLEAESDVGEGTSKSNSAIVHTGFDAKAGTLEAELLRRSRVLWPALLDSLSVPFLSVGAIMLARSNEEVARLRAEVVPAAEAQGVPVDLLELDALRDIAPYVTDEARAAVSIPDESIIDPFWLTRSYAEAAVSGGAEVRRRARVVGLEVLDDGVVVTLADGTRLDCDLVFDCAGLRADEVAGLAGDGSFAITARKGQLLVSEETFGVEHIVLPIPGRTTKGMLVTPIVFGGLLLGPTAVDQPDKDDRSIDAAETARILSECRGLVPAVADARPVRAFAGLRTVSSTGDYIVGPSAVSPRLRIVGGIRSTGISASPAIAERAVSDALAQLGWTRLGERRIHVPAPTTFADEPGELVCLCRGISRAEIDAACSRPLGPTTMDGLKRRGGATFGHCQGSLCGVEVATLLADARGIPVTAVEQGGEGSWLFAPSEPPAPTSRAALHGIRPGSGPTSSATDVVVVGGGRSGMAAAGVIRDRDLEVIVLEHRQGSSVIDVQPAEDGWQVMAQRPDGSATIECRAVIIATGGYVEPRGSRAIAGSRPSGIVTADYAERALDIGLVPGLQPVVVGSGARAAALTECFRVAGADVVECLDTEPLEVRGDRRLEGVRTATGWIGCDTLVLADRSLPQTFLLTTLGMVEPGPGSTPPVDAEGRLPAARLWACGCCVTADANHVSCVVEGARVGHNVARDLGFRAA